MMLAIDPNDEEFVIRVGTMVDVLVIVGGMGADISRESALARLLSSIAMSYDSKETLLEVMIEISENTLVHYIDSRDDRIFFCDTMFGGAAYMMDCGNYRVFYHNELSKITPRTFVSPSQGQSLHAKPRDSKLPPPG